MTVSDPFRQPSGKSRARAMPLVRAQIGSSGAASGGLAPFEVLSSGTRKLEREAPWMDGGTAIRRARGLV